MMNNPSNPSTAAARDVPTDAITCLTPIPALDTPSFRTQYAREMAVPLSPLQGHDRDIALEVKDIDQNAARQAGRRFMPVTTDVER